MFVMNMLYSLGRNASLISFFFSHDQNHFTVRKSFQNFLVEKTSRHIDACICILINSLEIRFGAILKNINPVIYKVKCWLFLVEH